MPPPPFVTEEEDDNYYDYLCTHHSVGLHGWMDGDPQNEHI